MRLAYHDRVKGILPEAYQIHGDIYPIDQPAIVFHFGVKEKLNGRNSKKISHSFPLPLRITLNETNENNLLFFSPFVLKDNELWAYIDRFQNLVRAKDEVAKVEEAMASLEHFLLTRVPPPSSSMDLDGVQVVSQEDEKTKFSLSSLSPGLILRHIVIGTIMSVGCKSFSHILNVFEK